MPFLEEVLASDISYGSGFSASYAVQIVETLVNRYAVAKHPYKMASFSIRFGNKTLEDQILKVFDLFDRCGGMAGGFRILHRADFSTNNYTGVPTLGDQLALPIDEDAGTYQMVEWFGPQGTLTTRRRLLKKIVAGSALVGIETSPGVYGSPPMGTTVNYNTGVITLGSPFDSNGGTVVFGCYFHIPVAFNSDLNNIDWQTRLATNEYLLSSSIDLIEVLNPEDIA